MIALDVGIKSAFVFTIASWRSQIYSWQKSPFIGILFIQSFQHIHIKTSVVFEYIIYQLGILQADNLQPGKSNYRITSCV